MTISSLKINLFGIKTMLKHIILSFKETIRDKQFLRKSGFNRNDSQSNIRQLNKNLLKSLYILVIILFSLGLSLIEALWWIFNTN